MACFCGPRRRGGLHRPAEPALILRDHEVPPTLTVSPRVLFGRRRRSAVAHGLECSRPAPVAPAPGFARYFLSRSYNSPFLKDTP